MKNVARSSRPFSGKAQAVFSAEGVFKYGDVENGLERSRWPACCFAVVCS